MVQGQYTYGELKYDVENLVAKHRKNGAVSYFSSTYIFLWVKNEDSAIKSLVLQFFFIRPNINIVYCLQHNIKRLGTLLLGLRPRQIFIFFLNLAPSQKMLRITTLH
jgi:hypothetical protein